VVDAQANIRVNLDSGQALAELKALEKQIQFFNKSIIQGSAQAAKIQNEFSSSLIHNINATGKFTASMGKVHTETERFTNALEKNKLSAREYFRYSMASTKSFGKLFGKEFGTITKVAEERVKLLQTRHIELGRAADGAMRAVKIVPNSLDYSKPITQMQLAIQKQQIFNKLLDAGTTKLLNFGKNTQWAGRQLMVGFTIPLTILGGTAIRTFKEMEVQAIRFKKVYGDIFTTTGETDAALESIKKLAVEYTKYGVSITDTIKMAADAAAAGNSGAQLESVVSQATKLSVLGGVAQDQALEATIAIQNAFGATGKELDKTINFLNAVENQTVVALDDITQAIPKVAPVIQQLGGDIKDLALFMAAMQEGGVGAAEAANALKSGLASLINPTKAATEMAGQLGINLNAIVNQNAGDLKATVMTFATALQPLDDLAKARLIETIFGKYQFARISTLFENVSKSGTQAARVMQLATASTEELGIMAERELGITANSSAVKFQASIEKLKAALVPVGQAFAEALTPIIEFVTKALDKFNSFSEGTKKGIVTLIAVIGGIGPVLLMSIGLIANGIANIGKGINLVRKGYQSLTSGGQELGLSTQYLSNEQLEALSVANNLHNVHELLTDQFALEATALARLTTVYKQASSAATSFASTNPQFFAQGTAGKLQNPRFGKRMAKGGWVPGTGNKDSVPTVLMPGEFVVRKDAAKANSQTLEQMNKGGQTYRSMGTPSFGKVAYRAGGSAPTDPVFAHTQPNLGKVSSQDLRTLLDLGISQKDARSQNVLDLIRIADSAGVLPKYQKSGAVVTGGAGLPLDYSLNNLLNVANDLTANDFNPDGTLKEGKKAVSGKELKESLQRQLIQDSAATKETMSSLAISKKDRQNFRDSLLRRVSLIDDNALYSDKGNKDLGIRSFFDDGQDIIEKGLISSGSSPDQAKKKLEIAKRAIREVRLNFSEPLYNLLKKEGIIQEVESKGSTRRYRVKGESQIREVYTHTPKATSFDKKVEVPKLSTSQSSGRRPRLDQLLKNPQSSLTFGAAANISGRRMGPFKFRAKGTPSYGEQGVTPAMLTPGEFVVNSESAQKFGPQLQGMNKGGMAYRADPSGPGYDFKVTDRRSSAQGINTPLSQSSAARSSMEQSLGSATGTINNVGKKVIERLTTALEKNKTVVDKNTETLDDGTKQSGRIAARQRMSRGANSAGMIGFGISGAAMAVGMMSKDEKTQQLASNISFASGTIGSLAMAIPMLMNPLVAMTVALIGIPASLILMQKSVDNARKNGYEFAQSMSNTSKDLEAMGEMTGNISRSEIAQRQKQNRLSPINPLKSDFGDTFITSDLGKKLLSQTSELTKNNFGANSGEIIGSKLADYVVEGLVDPAQAQSIAEAIGSSLGSEDIALNINGKLQEIIGINGNDLYKDPLEVRIRLIQESTAINQDFVNSIETQLGKVDAEQIWSDSGFYNFSGIGSSLGKAIKGEERDLLKVGDLLLGTNMFKNKEVAKLAGQQLGYNQSLLQTSQKALDTYNSQIDVKRQEFIEQEKILRNAITNTKNAKDQISLQDKLNKLIRDRGSFEAKYQEGRVDIVDQQKQSLDFVMKTFTANKKLQGQMLKASSEAVTGTYKGTPLEGVAGAFAAQADQFKNKEVTFLINTQVASGNIGLEAAMSLISIMTGKDGKLNEDGIQKQITLYAEAKGIGVEGLDRILSATTEVQDRFKRGETINLFRDLKPEAFDKATSFLETATNLSNKDVNMTAVIDTLSIDQMVAAGEDIAKINKEIPDKVTKEALIKFAQSDTDFAGIEANAEWFNSLPDEQTKLAIQIYRTVFETIDADKVRQDIENSKKIAKAQGRFSGSVIATSEEIGSETVRQTMAIIKKYMGPESEYTKGISDLVDDTAGGAGASAKILTTQLIQLRMKGLDPAALSTLDKASADKILSGTAKQQRGAIAALNAELRDQAIQLEVLKTDQEVLQDTMGATTNAISSYVDMLQQTRINPIQDQIDQYNELSNAQQKQMDLYGRGLQQLSDKEDGINKLYDDRISAIDKVTQANDRALQRQQNQIDLASAIASGDFGAAASAAANISNTEAQAQIEDARTALEQQRQAELKALTIEVNGQLYTREQIETNIKNLEESIYQTSLLVRQEQEKIAAIEKTITAEKEKQRKLQVLTQMSQLSTQMQTTVNQSARQAMGAQLGYLGQSIGLDPNDPSSIAATSQSLGINVQALADSILRSQQIATLTATEFAIEAEKAKKKAGDLSRFYGEASVEGKNSLAYLTTLNTAWAGDSKKSGLGGMVSTGRDILSSLSQSADAIRIGKNQIQNSVDSALAAIRSARKPFAMGGSVKRMAMGGNVNYKGSTEPAPVKMAVGNLVPGLGNTDRVPALLTPGEFVVRKSVAKQNLGLLKALNGDVFPQMSGGIGANAVMVPITNTNMEGSTTLYNNTYSVNVNVGGTNSTADEVANVVIRKIKGMNDRGIRGNRY